MEEESRLNQLRQMALQSMPNNSRTPMLLKQQQQPIRPPQMSSGQMSAMNPMMQIPMMSQHSGLYPTSQHMTSMINPRLPIATTAMMGPPPRASNTRIRPASMATHNMMRNSPIVTSAMMGNTPMMGSQMMAATPNQMMGNTTMMSNPMMRAGPNQMMGTSPNQMMGTTPNQMMGTSPNQMMATAQNQMMGTVSNQMMGKAGLVNPHSLPPPPPPPGPPPAKSAMPYSVLGKMPANVGQYAQQSHFSPSKQNQNQKIISPKKKVKHMSRTPTQSASDRSSSTSRSRSRSWSRSRSRTRSRSTSASSQSGSRSSYGHSPSLSASSRSHSRSRTRSRSRSYSDSESDYSSRSSSRSPSPVRKRKRGQEHKKKTLDGPSVDKRKLKRQEYLKESKHHKDRDRRHLHPQSPPHHAPWRRPPPDHSRVHEDHYHRRPLSPYDYHDVHSSSVSPRKRRQPDGPYRGGDRYMDLPDSLKDRLAPRRMNTPPRVRERRRRFDGSPRMPPHYSPEFEDFHMQQPDRRRSPLHHRRSRSPPVFERRGGRGNFGRERRMSPYRPRHTLESTIVRRNKTEEEKNAIPDPTSWKETNTTKSPQKKPLEAKKSPRKEEKSAASEKKDDTKEEKERGDVLNNEHNKEHSVKDVDSANESVEEGERVSTSPSVSASELQEDTKETGNSADMRTKANMFGEGEDAIEFNEDYDDEFDEELNVPDEGGTSREQGIPRRRISSPIQVSPSCVRGGGESFPHGRQRNDHRGQHRDDVMPDLPKELARRLGPKKKSRDLSSRLGSVSTKGSAEEIARRHKMEKERLKKKRSGEFVRRGPR